MPLKKFRNIHRKSPVLGSLFNKVAGLKIGNVIEKRLQRRRFPVNIAKVLRTAFHFMLSSWVKHRIAIINIQDLT